MATELKNLVTIANYAAKKGVSTTAVYQWIAAGRVKMVEIDGKQFIDTKSSK